MKGVIYRIYDNTNGNIYYGSTIQSLSNRMASHRSNYKKWIKGDKRTSCKSFEIIKNGDYDYNIVEEIECENKYELHNRERYYIENNECVNKLIPNRTKKEYNKQYREDNKDKIKDNKKQYYENNKDKIKEKQYYEDNKDKILEKKKNYHKNNKDKINEKKKNYYEDNKNKINEKITCECGCIVFKKSLNRHRKSKKHLKLIS